MTTSNQPDAPAKRVSALARLTRDAGGPAVSRSLGRRRRLALKLCEHDHFTCKDWFAALADELKAADDVVSRMMALERLVIEEPRPIVKRCANAKRHRRNPTSILPE